MATISQGSSGQPAKGGYTPTPDDLELTMMRYDRDGNGEFCVSEVRAIVQDLQNQKEKTRDIKRVLVTSVVFFTAMCGVLMGLVFAANEASKEAHVEGETMTNLNGEAVATADVQSFGNMLDFLSYDFVTLENLDFVVFSTVEQDDDNSLDCETAESFTEHFMKVAVFERNAAADRMVLSSPISGITIEITEAEVNLIETSSDGIEAPTPICLESSADSTVLVSSDRRHLIQEESHRRLGRRAAFITTGGSFTLSSGSSGAAAGD